MRVVKNPWKSDQARNENQEALKFHKKLPLYKQTALIDSDVLAKEMGVKKVLLKVESFRFGLPAFKMLGIRFQLFEYVGLVFVDDVVCLLMTIFVLLIFCMFVDVFLLFWCILKWFL